MTHVSVSPYFWCNLVSSERANKLALMYVRLTIHVPSRCYLSFSL